MDLPQNITPTPCPNICEAGHERLPTRHETQGEDPRLLSQPEIKIIRLSPCSQSRDGISIPGSAIAEARCQDRASRAPVASSQKPPAQTRACTTRRKPTLPHLKPTHTHTHIPISSNRPPIPIKPTPSTRIHNSLKHGSIPRKHAYTKQEEMGSMPSTSSLASSITDPTVTNRLDTPPTPPNSPCPTPSLVRKCSMSERAAETVRIMEWAKARVETAETRAREREHAEHKEEEFLLRLRMWEAEIKVRRMQENAEGEMADEDVRPANGCSDRGIFWVREQSGMERFKNFVWERRKRCWRGLTCVLEQ